MNSIVNFFTPRRGDGDDSMVSSSSSGSKRYNDDVFLDYLKLHYDLLREVCTNNYIVCCPCAATIGGETISKQVLKHHIIIPILDSKDYFTNSGLRLTTSGNDLICGSDFSQERRVHILSTEQKEISLGADSNKYTIKIYRISRPFVMGIDAPNDVDEISTSVMFKYTALLRSYPATQAVFAALDATIKDINYVADKSENGLSQIRPSLHAVLRSHWRKASDALINSSAGSSCFGNASQDDTICSIEQVVETYMMHALYGSIYHWLCETCVAKDLGMLRTIQMVCKHGTQTDVGIRCEFQTDFRDAIGELCLLREALTPADKLLVMKNTVTAVREAVDRHVERSFPGEELDMATDDVILLLVWVICQVYPYYKRVTLDIQYVMDYHFVSSSRSRLGFTLCHFQVALMWFVDKARILYPKETTFDGGNLEGEALKFEEQSPDHVLKKDDSSDDGFVDAKEDHNLVDKLSLGVAEAAAAPRKDSDGFFSEKARESSKLEFSMRIQLQSNKDAYCSWKDSSSASSMSIDNATLASTARDKKFGKTCKVLVFGIDERHSWGGKKSQREVRIDTERTNKPGGVAGISGAGGVGGSYFAALNEDGFLYTWGLPDCGRLGRGAPAEIDSFLPQSSPKRVLVDAADGSDVRFKAFACGQGHMLAVTEEGDLYAWGDNRCAQLGVSGKAPASESSSRSRSSLGGGGDLSPLEELSYVMTIGPVKVKKLSHLKIDAVACGRHHSLCLTSEGRLLSWGRHAGGRLGQSDEIDILPRHSVGKPAPVKWNYRVTKENQLMSTSALGDSAAKKTATPVNSSPKVSSSSSSGKVSLSAISAVPYVRISCIAAGFSHSIAISTDGAAFTWGTGLYGRLGHGSHCNEGTPRQVRSLSVSCRFTSCSAGLAHSLFLSSDGMLFGCGLDADDQVGGAVGSGSPGSGCKYDRVSVLVPRPTMHSFAAPVVAAACGDMHSVAATADGRVYVWGECGVERWYPPSAAMRGSAAAGRKVDITALLEGGVPVEIGAAGSHSCVVVRGSE